MGAHFSFTAKRTRRITAIPKAGTLPKNRKVGSRTLSKPLRMYAARAPSRLPSSQPTRIAGNCRQIVHMMALEIMLLTDLGYWLKESPKSP